MKVFISWSGEFSKRIALLIKDWIEQCIQSIEAFVSDEDIEKGENWSARLTNELSNTNYGIVCLTSDNISAPWIHFEAGALSKLVDSRVSTIAVDIQYSEIKGPLSSFQNTKLEKEDMFSLLKSINNSIEKSGEKNLSDEKLKNSFDAFWQTFNIKLKKLFDDHKKEPVKKQTSKMQIQQESFDELLQLMRNQNAIITDPSRLLPIEYIDYIVNQIRRGGNDEILFEIIYRHIKNSIGLLRNFGFENEEYFLDSVMFLIEEISGFSKDWRLRLRPLKEEINYICLKNDKIKRIPKD
ncbi:MAG: toll/interleukin-1 receptor domain-containing protein [Clostridia bacterium]|nr:toll/interleukin-1 receptor domain-containing protein [Clostridia bacterium]